MTPPLDGRVFARLRRFANLPADLQEDTKQFQAYAEQHKAQIFQIHHAALIKPVFSVKGKALIDAVIQWLQERETAAQSATTVVQQAAAAVTSVVGTVVEAVKDALTTDDSAKTTTDAPASASAITTPATEAPKPTPAAASPELREHARQISEALVLSGFLTPYKDNEKHLNAATPDHYVRDSDLLIPISRSVTELKTTSVWSVVNGAIHASFLKRKGGVLAHFTHGKDVYVVFNEKTNTAYVFESDLARAPIAELAGETLIVEFDNTHFEFGVRVVLSSGDEKEKPELFNALSKPQQEEFLNAWLNIGAHYREAFNANIENVKSIYELKDRDIIGNEVSFDKYKGKVLLVVNVSSKCGLTPTNYPELTLLDERYREQGLEILAFPCNQFSNQEPGTHEEIMEFVKQYNAQYTFFEKGDVNGASARPVFTYLKAKLPGSFGNFVKWNFTKFLVDRNGQPYKRFAPKDLPLSFEDDIKALLEKPVTDALEAELLGEAEAAVEEMKGEPAPTETLDVAFIEVKTAEQPIAASVAPAAT